MISFFSKPTLNLAKSLLGSYLIHKTPQGIISGIIIETEAYLNDDPASHSFNGKTKRNSPMFLPPGHVYIYFTYGMHYCFNIVSNKEGIGEAILIRSLEPLKGINLMKNRRKTQDLHNLCSGPAKLVQALGITKDQNSLPLQGNLKIIPKEQSFTIVTTTRIGISHGSFLPYRFYIKGNIFLSKP